jgi:serine/threonine protein kinase
MEIVEPGYTLAVSTPLLSTSTTVSFSDLYERDERLRSGSFGTVYTCHHKLHPDMTYAVKILHRKNAKQDEAVHRETAILKQLKELPHVVRLIDFFVDPTDFYMVQVYAAGGDVFDRLSARSNYTEKDARDLAKILLETIEDMHEARIVHRDLKPENLLLKSASDDTSILLADFGFARTVPTEGCKTRCGTPVRRP